MRSAIHLSKVSKKADAHELFVQIGKDHGKNFKETFDELRQMLLSVNPVMLLSILSFLSCFANSLRNPLRTLKYAVLQHHVELFQGLVLVSQLEQFGFKHPIPPQMQRFIELVAETEQSFAIRRYADVDPAVPLEERHTGAVVPSFENTDRVATIILKCHVKALPRVTLSKKPVSRNFSHRTVRL